MTAQERSPTRDELLAMAYADGELDATGRANFERRMKASPELVREVVELQRLAIIARQMAPPEPTDLVWGELEDELFHRGGRGLGFTFLLTGVIGLMAWGGIALAADEGIPVYVKLFLGAVTLGLFLLFVVVLRGRIRTRPYDPYTEVRR